MKRTSSTSKKRIRQRGCRYLCCGHRLNTSSSSEEADESTDSDCFPRMSSLAHAMVQERLDQMIRERQDARALERAKKPQRIRRTEFIVMVAMEMSSHDPMQDFRDSMVEIIIKHRVEDVKDLRSLLNWYLSVNSKESWSTILAAFHEVCTNLFLGQKCR